MSVNKLIVPGFGVGACYGIPTTVTIDSSAVYTISAGQWYISGLGDLVAVNLINTIDTTTISIFSGYLGSSGTAGGWFFSDGQNLQVENTNEGSVDIVLVSTNSG